MSNRNTNIIAAILLLMVFLLCFFAVKDDSLTMDEVAHLPAGYSYLTQQDMRLNPEHPPLLKDLAAVPLLFIKNINFPSEIKAWKDDTNGQWDFGFNFLYKAGNSADEMIFWGRIPMILILVLLGFYVFKWARELFDNRTGLLALFLFAFSPTLLAHGSLVTTDVGAAAGIFIASYYFIKALKSSSKKNIILAGIFFGLAQLCKFSVILLLPFYLVIAFFWWLSKSAGLKQVVKTSIFVFLIGFLLIWPVYQFHTWNYPEERQTKDTIDYLSNTPDFIKKPVIWAADKPILRPYVQYLTGLFMVFHRVAGGNTTYFLGEVSNKGWNTYFPIIYLIKVPLAFHLLTLVALFYAFRLIKISSKKNILKQILNWIKSHFSEFSMLIFIVMYWVVSIIGSLNIGVRHLLPIFPFTILLVSAFIIKLIKEPYLKLKYFVLAILILWQAFSVISVYPHFLAYFNELTGGAEQGYIYAVDSNLDWGQDLKRLDKWVNNQKINKIYVDYFGGAKPEYYLKSKYVSWHGTNKEEDFPRGNYLAISATFLQGGKGKPIVDIPQAVNYYQWLNNYEPVARIGYSIFVYHID